METKYDIFKREEQERKQREANIQVLTNELTEAKILLRVLHSHGATDYKAQQNRAIVSGEIKRLNELIEDEKNAIKSLDGGHSDEVVAKMGL